MSEIHCNLTSSQLFSFLFLLSFGLCDCEPRPGLYKIIPQRVRRRARAHAQAREAPPTHPRRSNLWLLIFFYGVEFRFLGCSMVPHWASLKPYIRILCGLYRRLLWGSFCGPCRMLIKGWCGPLPRWSRRASGRRPHRPLPGQARADFNTMKDMLGTLKKRFRMVFFIALFFTITLPYLSCFYFFIFF